ncbi:NAD dependent epimerase/dehydratase family [Verrucomicrobiia bacterium DG1235]|nr:NAD dependent epimerase/dehydratase family [Verrucomicrobiae bacterium DG1235]
MYGLRVEQKRMNTREKHRILILGGSGTVGSAVAEVFAESGEFEVHSVSRRSTSTIEGVFTHCIDLHASSLVNDLPKIEFDYIVDCAQPRYNAEDVDDFGIDHIKNIEAICSTRTKRLLYTSGVWVYGSQSGSSVISEKSPLAPLDYAKPRIPILEYLKESSYPWVQLCLPSIVYGSVGPFQDILRSAYQNDLVSIDDERVLWSVVERCDLATAYLSIIERCLSGPVYCIAEPRAVSVVEFFDSIGHALDRQVSRKSREELSKIQSREDLEVSFASEPVDSSLIVKDANWIPKHSYVKDFQKFIKKEELNQSAHTTPPDVIHNAPKASSSARYFRAS